MSNLSNNEKFLDVHNKINGRTPVNRLSVFDNRPREDAWKTQ